MNFVLVIADTLRRDHLGCYGNGWISTPHIDRFAAKSIVFDRAYAASFPTVPHRHDVFTGRYTFIDSQWGPLPRNEVVLAEELVEVGYTSMMILDEPHIVENGFHYDRGFTGWEWIRGQETDRWQTAPAFPPLPADASKLRAPDRQLKGHQRNIHWWQFEESTFVAQTMTAACRWLDRNWKQHESFFLYVDTFDPHEPWDAPRWYVEMYDPGHDGHEVTYPLCGPCDYLTPKELRHARALYAAEVTLVDRWVGRLLQKIEDMGLFENSVIVFTTDHGFYHGEHGLIGKSFHKPARDVVWFHYVPLYEEVAHIPLIVHYPGCKAHRERAFVQPPDFMPTFLELAGARDPGTMHGASLVPILTGKLASLRDWVVTSPTIIHGAAAGTRPSITTDDWALICAGTPPEEGEFETLAVDGLIKRQPPGAQFRSELYHLASDPHQMHNVIDAHPDVAAELRQVFLAFLEGLGTDPGLIKAWCIPQ
jgi:arylsulfatase A-like enzyme